MGSNAKKRTTMAKLNREAKLRDKRIEKQARKDARRLEAAAAARREGAPARGRRAQRLAPALLLVVLDGVRVAHRGAVRVRAGGAQRAPLAEQVPAAVELHRDLSSCVLSAASAASSLLSRSSRRAERVLLRHEPLDAGADALVGHGVTILLALRQDPAACRSGSCGSASASSRSTAIAVNLATAFDEVPDFVVLNFFSYFTNLSNILAASC